MSEIFHEVEEEVRRDQWMMLWKRYGALLIALLVAIVGGVAGYQIWTHMSAEGAAEQTGELIKASQPLNFERYDDAIASLSAARDTLSGDVRAMALFREAQARIGDDDMTGAVATLDAIANDGSVDDTLRSLATIYAASLEVDRASFDEINARLGPIAQDENSPFRSSAIELIGFSAVQNGRFADARDRFMALSADPSTTPDMRQRATAALSAVSSKVEGSE